MNKDFLSFLASLGLPLHQVNSSTLLCYMEYVIQNGYSNINIANNMAAVKSKSLVYGQNIFHFSDKGSLFLKSIGNNAQRSPPVKSLIDVEVLSNILQDTRAFPYAVVYQSFYLFCFFSFLRISNILPHIIASFDLSRHLSRDDVIFGPQ